MLSASLKEDIFFGYSMPPEMAGSWLEGTQLRSWIWEGRAWCLVVAVHMQRRRFFGVPMLGDQKIVTLMHIVEYRDRQGRLCKGNFFLQGRTDSLSLAALVSSSSWKLQGGPTEIAHGKVSVPGFRASIEPSKRISKKLGPVLKGDHSGVLRIFGATRFSALTKSHWDMRPLGVSGERCQWLDGKQAKLEFAFESSNSLAHWPWWRKVQAG